MFLNFHYSLNTNCYDSGGKFVTKLPTNTTKCDNKIDTCNRIGELNTVIFRSKKLVQVRGHSMPKYTNVMLLLFDHRSTHLIFSTQVLFERPLRETLSKDCPITSHILPKSKDRTQGIQCTLIHGYIKSPNTKFVFLLESMPYDVKIGPQ